MEAHSELLLGVFPELLAVAPRRPPTEFLGGTPMELLGELRAELLG